MSRKCIGVIETIGLASAIQAADTALKTANVRLLGYEYSGYDARIVVKIEGKVSAVEAALKVAAVTTCLVKGELSGYEKYSVKSALNEAVYNTLLHNAQTVGDELQIQSGKRPQGTGKTGKWIGRWNPKGCYIYE